MSSSLPKVVFLDKATIPAHIEFRELNFPHQWVEYDYTSPEQLAERLQDADIVISNKVQLNAQMLSQYPKIKLIAVSATGTNNVDLEYCRTQNIAVCNIQGYATRSVPEHAISMIFALKRNLFAYHQDIANGVWQHDKQFCFFTHPITDVAESTIAIVGSGNLGEGVATLSRALGMQVIFAERKGCGDVREGYVSFESALQQADIVTLHCPLTDATTDLIAAKELALMKPTAILINAGRGGLVNESDLVEALKSAQIAGAGVDVFTQEPADESNPLLANISLPNLLLTPHVAWGSDSALTSLVNILLNNIEHFMQGKSLNRVV
ncbi:glycerate dehydrogenase [Vibrio sp. UCD-FRSSP16_10]|uniref:D-2-hydroxyacid dehydrogenase n=1 Tax=unclassified Vibrio TaxID=2614977 RepID=UPI0007FC9FAE|nr:MULTISPECIES: D-2-hydroxyacid dehydrogenase [unclassified Vibrio]OBT16753.1 glycerate dehydrogenase [Vibrio sp. UCD-FRSSP16_30]OBT21380.1 glycerate dehydrogenase [Vibrio sp. UCD-FRSSP16_10]